jgi:alkanesulfonate monooxygenase SsuD/methylene tetrahydromethanopterin reductase-like flavin-dependent oxidoreductase (luciferase family)
MVAVAVICAEDDERARYLAGPARLSMARLRTGRPARFPSNEEAAAHQYSPDEQAVARSIGGGQAIGGPETVKARLDDLAERTGADELMLTTMVYDHADRIASYERVAELYELRGAVAEPSSTG